MLEISNEKIPANIYQALRVQTGLSPKGNKASEIALNNSLYSVLIKNENGEPIGMGRIIGDGGCFCQIVDVCVLPSLQGKGIGKVIMGKIMDFIKNELPETCYISLIADRDASKLYEKYGFKDTLPASKGMYIKI